MINLNRALLGGVISVIMFVVLGTVAALWENPLFFRMTPVSGFETTLLAIQALLVGGYIAIKPPACSNKSVTFGSVIHFLGIACPVCNKILLYVVGSEILLLYFEPYRIYVAAAGALITAGVVIYLSRDQIGPLRRSSFSGDIKSQT